MSIALFSIAHQAEASTLPAKTTSAAHWREPRLPQPAEPEREKHEACQRNTIVAEYYKIMPPDIVHQAGHHSIRYRKYHHRPDGDQTPLHSTDKYPGWQEAYPRLGSNAPYRGVKGQLYEGGIRTPTIVNWRDKLSARKVDSPVQVVDWMPTFTALVGAEPQEDPRYSSP